MSTDQAAPAVDGHTITRHELDGAHAWACTCGAGREWALKHAWAVEVEASKHLADVAYLAALPGRDLRELLDDYGSSGQFATTVFPGITHDPRTRSAALRAEIDRRIAALTKEQP